VVVSAGLRVVVGLSKGSTPPVIRYPELSLDNTSELKKTKE
jgi:hypothetical protein